MKGLEVGQLVDQFRIIRKLGQGGMSEVYLARDTTLGRKVALKLIRAEFADSSKRLQLFLGEARLTAKFSHPHIIAIHSVGDFKGHPYLALEYLEGQTLKHRMSEGAMSARETMRIGLAIAQALQEAHSHGVLHRDLKPANVILPQDGRLRVLDFGISKIVEDSIHPPVSVKGLAIEVKPEQTALGEYKGTPSYMAPERWLKSTATGAADVWALGVVLYRMLTQVHPFPSADQSVESIARCILLAQEPLSFPPDVDVPPELSQLITSMLEATPSQRPTAKQIVEELQGLLQRKLRKSLEQKSPFRGLLPFSERHADIFFGRSAEIEMAIERLRHEPILPVVGPSGAGKSSFVAAGIIPRLRELDRWLVLTIRPGTDPFGALSSIIQAAWRGEAGHTTSTTNSVAPPLLTQNENLQATEYAPESKALPQAMDTLEGVDIEETQATTDCILPKKINDFQDFPSNEPEDDQAASPGELAQKLLESPARLVLELQALAEKERGRVLLFVDQLEELYTQAHTMELRRSYMEAISYAADDPDGPIRVVFTLREDFLGRVIDTPKAQEALSRITVLRAIGEEALQEIVRKPVELAGYSYEDKDLPQEMIDAVRDASASLPILQFACSQLWNRRDREKRLLTRAAYRAMGGVEGALASEADEQLAGLSEKQQHIVRQLMLRFVTPEGTRRVMAAQELLDGLDAAASFVLERLTQARIVVSRRRLEGDSNEAEFELAHDSLIHSWKPLARWLEQSHEEVVFLDEITRAADLWNSRGRPREEVWSGDALDEARIKLKRCTAVPQGVTTFLEAGELHRLARARSRRRITVATFSTMLAVIALLALMNRETEIQRERALNLVEEAREQRERQQQAHASALREGARAAYTKGDYIEARSRLRDSLEIRDSAQARALWWLLENEPLIWSQSLDAYGSSISVSPDGRLIAVSSNSISIYNIKTLERRVLSGHRGQISAVTFSPNGRWLSSGAYDHEVRLWDLNDGTVKVLKGHTGAVQTVAFSPDGQHLISGSLDKTIKIWDIESGTPIRTLNNEAIVSDATFSSNGRYIITVSQDDKLRFWNARSLELEQVIEEPGMRILDAVTSPDGKLLAYNGWKGTLIVRELDTLRELKRISGNSNSIRSLNFSPDGDFLAATTILGNVQVWKTQSWSLHRQFQHSNTSVHSVSFLPDGEQIVSTGDDGNLKLWSIDVDSVPQKNSGHRFSILAVAFSPNNTNIITGSAIAGELYLWDTASGQSISQIDRFDSDVLEITFNHMGNLFAVGGDKSSIVLYTFPEINLVKNLLGHSKSVSGILFSRDGTQLISLSKDNTVAFWDLGSLTLHKSFSAENLFNSIDTDPENRFLVLGNREKIALRNFKTGQILKTLSGHTSFIWSVVFSPDGKSLYSSGWDYTARRYQLSDASTKGELVARHQGNIYWIDVMHKTYDILGTPSADKTSKLWNMETGAVITLTGHRGEVNRLKFSPDGTRVATVSDDATLRLWDTNTGKPVWRAPLMLEEPPTLFTHQGWISFENDAEPAQSTKQWQKAVEARGKLASATTDQQTLCLATFADELEIWSMPNDERTLKKAAQKIHQILAIRRGCLTLSDRTLTLTKNSGETLPMGKQVEAMSRFEDSVFILQDDTIRILDLDGIQKDEVTATAGASALTIVGDTLVLGYPDRRIEVWKRHKSRATKDLECSEVESSPVTAIRPGPPGTFIAGFANGTVGIWSIETGERLYTQRLHGPVIHLLQQNQKLFAATELGSKLQLDLSTFYTDYCALMKRVWSSVPWIWKEGRARYRERPTDHVCAGPR